MDLGKVIGTVVATRKDEKLQGTTLQVVQIVDIHVNPKDSFVIAIDSVGAGQGEVVLCARGSSARMTNATENKPVDAVIMGIVDVIEINGETYYEKHKT